MILQPSTCKVTSVRLGEVCSFKSGNSLTNGQEFLGQENGFLLLKVSDLNRTENTPVIKTASSWVEAGVMESTSCKPGSVIIPKRGGAIATNKKRLLGRPAALDPNLMGIEPNPNKVDSLYLYFWFQQFDLTQITSGSAVPQLNKQDLAPLKFPLLPIAQQRRIADILDRADAVRRKRQQAISLTEELLRSAFLEMFGDPVANPKGWKVYQLDQFSDIQSGIAKGKKIDPSKAISVPYMRVANVQDGYLDLSDIKEIQILPIDLSRYSLKQGDLLLTEGGDPDKLGRGAVWYGEVQPCIHQNHIFCVRPDKSVADPEYLSTLIGSNYGKRYFLKAAKQTTGIATINKTQLRNFPALLPPLPLQQKYNQLVSSIRSMRKNVEDVNGQTGCLFNSLLQRAFQGEL